MWFVSSWEVPPVGEVVDARVGPFRDRGNVELFSLPPDGEVVGAHPQSAFETTFAVGEAGGIAEGAVRMPYRLAVALRSAAKPEMLPPAVSAIAYAASLAETIIIDAIAWSNGQVCPGVNPMHMHSRPAALGVTEIKAVGESRSTATRAVMIFTVLAAAERAGCGW